MFVNKHKQYHAANLIHTSDLPPEAALIDAIPRAFPGIGDTGMPSKNSKGKYTSTTAWTSPISMCNESRSLTADCPSSITWYGFFPWNKKNSIETISRVEKMHLFQWFGKWEVSIETKIDNNQCQVMIFGLYLHNLHFCPIMMLCQRRLIRRTLWRFAALTCWLHGNS